MRILVLGGTKFVGLHIVKEALKRKHTVTVFNRGTAGDIFEGRVEQLIGDRDGNLNELEGKKWDVVIDTAGYLPRLVKDSASFLSNSCGKYVFISTISVYNDFSSLNMDESFPVGKLENEKTEEVNGETYGPLKALCEAEVKNYFKENNLIIRPGLIVGPDDYTGRFTYWPRRIARGGKVLSPGNPEALLQFIDVRDLAKFVLHLIEEEKTGTYNATGPKEPLTFKSFLENCKETLNPHAELIWADVSFLKEQEITPWTELPLFVPPSEKMVGFLAFNITKALKDGLTFRKLSETIKDTYEWDHNRNVKDNEMKAGLDSNKENLALEKLLKK
ncbi:SDR family oxidoreductase [Bacillus timonensis]|nr:SDR family oxidoreductase [Bacillus timonensis]